MTKKEASKLEILAVKLASAENAVTAAQANMEKELKVLGAGTVVMLGGKPHKVVLRVTKGADGGDGWVGVEKERWHLRCMISPGALALMGHPVT